MRKEEQVCGERRFANRAAGRNATIFLRRTPDASDRWACHTGLRWIHEHRLTSIRVGTTVSTKATHSAKYDRKPRERCCVGAIRGGDGEHLPSQTRDALFAHVASNEDVRRLTMIDDVSRVASCVMQGRRERERERKR